MLGPSLGERFYMSQETQRQQAWAAQSGSDAANPASEQDATPAVRRLLAEDREVDVLNWALDVETPLEAFGSANSTIVPIDGDYSRAVTLVLAVNSPVLWRTEDTLRLLWVVLNFNLEDSLDGVNWSIVASSQAVPSTPGRVASSKIRVVTPVGASLRLRVWATIGDRGKGNVGQEYYQTPRHVDRYGTHELPSFTANLLARLA